MKELVYKTEIDLQTQKINLWLPKGKGRGINQESGINRYTLLHIKQKNNKDLMYSTENYIQYLIIIIYNRKESKKGYIYIYIYIFATESLYGIPKTW